MSEVAGPSRGPRSGPRFSGGSMGFSEFVSALIRTDRAGPGFSVLSNRTYTGAQPALSRIKNWNCTCTSTHTHLRASPSKDSPHGRRPRVEDDVDARRLQQRLEGDAHVRRPVVQRRSCPSPARGTQGTGIPSRSSQMPPTHRNEDAICCTALAWPWGGFVY